MEFVAIEPGSFTMGSVTADSLRIANLTLPLANEQPAHQVTLSRRFWLGRHEVTQAQWEAVMGSNPSHFQGPRRPLEQVCWNDVQVFIDRLNQAAGQAVYRLPTEAEWEYACRAGTAGRWSFGDRAAQLGAYAWWPGNSAGQTHEVGQKRPNPWGLYDMHGNVWEWVQDWYGPYAAAAQTDPAGPETGVHRVFRGGGWRFGDASAARSALRLWQDPALAFPYVGFRLARTAD
jgi:formylglycine-generating enzyme required for sulfatase activity